MQNISKEHLKNIMNHEETNFVIERLILDIQHHWIWMKKWEKKLPRKIFQSLKKPSLIIPASMHPKTLWKFVLWSSQNIVALLPQFSTKWNITPIPHDAITYGISKPTEHTFIMTWSEETKKINRSSLTTVICDHAWRAARGRGTPIHKSEWQLSKNFWVHFPRTCKEQELWSKQQGRETAKWGETKNKTKPHPARCNSWPGTYNV